MIYHITYISDGLKVKGYLGIPNEFTIPVSLLQQTIQQIYGCNDLPILQLTSTLKHTIKPMMFTKMPVLIYCRGGIGKVGKVRTSWIEDFTEFGYIVFAPSYRGNEGGEGRDEFGGADRNDVVDAYQLLQRLPFVKKDSISIMGFSRGAINAAEAAVMLTDVCSLILWGGVSSLSCTYEERIELRRMLKRVLRGSPNKNPDAYDDRSPIKMAEHIHCPVLIIHGTADVQVDFSHGENMYKTLQTYSSAVEILPLEGYGHHLPLDFRPLVLDHMFHWIGTNYNRNRS